MTKKLRMSVTDSGVTATVVDFPMRAASLPEQQAALEWARERGLRQVKWTGGGPEYLTTCATCGWPVESPQACCLICSDLARPPGHAPSEWCTREALEARAQRCELVAQHYATRAIELAALAERAPAAEPVEVEEVERGRVWTMLDQATGEALDHIAETAGVQRHRPGTGPGEFEPDDELRYRVRCALRGSVRGPGPVSGT